MKIAAISDTHGDHSELEIPEADVLVVAGDITDNGSHREVKEFDKWLESLEYDRILFTPGNHDTCFINSGPEPASLLKNATYLLDESIEIKSKKFYFTPWVPELPSVLSVIQSSELNKPREALKEKFSQIPDDTDLLVTHAPPRGVRDRTFLLHPRIPFVRAGSRALRIKVEEVNPEVHIFGHIHKAHGRQRIDETLFVNASIHRYYQEAVNQPQLIDI